MKKFIFLSFCLLIGTGLRAQPSDSLQVAATIAQFVRGIVTDSTALIRPLLLSEADLKVIQQGNRGAKVAPGSVQKFLSRIEASHAPKRLEIQELNIRVESPSAYVDMRYRFYLNDEMVRLGVVDFVLQKLDQSWKITSIVNAVIAGPENID